LVALLGQFANDAVWIEGLSVPLYDLGSLGINL
jgi:hypothetical protein